MKDVKHNIQAKLLNLNKKVPSYFTENIGLDT